MYLDEALAVRRPVNLIGVDNAVLQPHLVVVGVGLHPHAESISLEACPFERISYGHCLI